MFLIGMGMLLVFYYVSWRYMASEEFVVHCLALSISTVIGTVLGYFLVRSNVGVLIVSAGCASILLIIAQFVEGATMEEFIMWWQLAIFVFFIYSFAASLVAFPILDKLIAYPLRNKSVP